MNTNVDDAAFQPPATDKEVVIYKGGWGFRLPDQHEVLLSEDGQFVNLNMPQRGSTHHLDRVEETHNEYRIHVGEWLMGHALGDLEAKYPFPSIDEELARLKADYLEGGGKETDFNAWAQGASYDSHTSDVREWLRDMA